MGIQFSWLQLSLQPLALTAALAYLVLKLALKYSRASLSPLHALPGPKPHSLLLGDMPYVMTQPGGTVWKRWNDLYGSSHRFSMGLFAPPGLATADCTAIDYIIRNPELFVKPEVHSRVIRRIIGDGVVTANFHDHRRQRRILNPAFSTAAIRETVPVMFTKAAELGDRLGAIIDSAAKGPRAPDVVPGARKVDMNSYLTDMSFDIIGMAGFGYDFRCEARCATHAVFHLQQARRPPVPLSRASDRQVTGL